jgi:hypothetical protein
MSTLRTRIKDLRRYGDFGRYFTVAVCPPPNEMLGFYGYRIEDSPHFRGRRNEDPILETIIALISELAKEDIAVAGSQIQVWNLTGTNSQQLRHTNPHAVTFYAFKEHYQEFPITVPVTLTGSRLIKDSLLVRVQGSWMPMQAWLLALPGRKFLGQDSQFALVWQQRWWDKQREDFPSDGPSG